MKTILMNGVLHVMPVYVKFMTKARIYERISLPGKMLDLEDFDHVFSIRGEEEFDRVYQRIQLEEQENRRNTARPKRKCIPLADENNRSGMTNQRHLETVTDISSEEKTALFLYKKLQCSRICFSLLRCCLWRDELIPELEDSQSESEDELPLPEIDTMYCHEKVP
ncbi:hypothetical protein L9F63_005397, partial [Diploptera punctata]